ncbi:Uncharacterised protein [Vibrio cholerae]|nr:Uncharacterised protein [Vibrio cholerae]
MDTFLQRFAEHVEILRQYCKFHIGVGVQTFS